MLTLGIFRGSFGHFSTLSEFSMHLFKSVSLVACLGPMQEMGMNVKHLATVARPQTLRYMVFKF